MQLEVFDLEEENFIELPLVFSTPKLPVASESVPRQEDVDRWPHLKGVTVAEINADVGLLIGHDVPKALEPKEVRESQNRGPYAAKTLLCWAGPSMAHLVGTEALSVLQTLFERTLPLINSFRGSATWSSTILCSTMRGRCRLRTREP